MYYVYFAKSLKSNNIYVGFCSKDPNIRILEHNEGSNSWTRANKPLELVYFESYFCEKDAILREKYYKTGIGKAIKKLIVNNINNILGR
jgi:putative endonuclease